MKDNYAEYVSLFKAISDQTRLKIVDILSGGEMCACQLLDNFTITQPTLSYHMRILCESGLVQGKRDGAWMYYSLSGDVIENISEFLFKIKSDTKQALKEQGIKEQGIIDQGIKGKGSCKSKEKCNC